MVREDLINVIVVGLVNSPPLSSARSHVSPACRARQYIAESRSSQAELIFRGLSDGISFAAAAAPTSAQRVSSRCNGANKG